MYTLNRIFYLLNSLYIQLNFKWQNMNVIQVKKMIKESFKD